MCQRMQDVQGACSHGILLTNRTTLPERFRGGNRLVLGHSKCYTNNCVFELPTHVDTHMIYTRGGWMIANKAMWAYFDANGDIGNR